MLEKDGSEEIFTTIEGGEWCDGEEDNGRRGGRDIGTEQERAGC